MANGIFTVLNVSNVDKSLEFYKMLGLKTSKSTMPTMTWGNVFSGAGSIMLYPKNDIAPNQAPDTRAWVSGDLGKGVVVTIGVPNATKTYEKARSFGAEIDEQLVDAPWGGKQFMVIDPDGYVVQLVDKPFPANPGAPKKTAAKGRTAAKGKGKKAKPKRKGR